MQTEIKPIYAYVPKELHSYLDKIKENQAISKSDFVYLAVCFFRERIDPHTIKEMSDCLLIHGPGGLEKWSINVQ